MCRPSCDSLTELLGAEAFPEDVRAAHETWHRTACRKHFLHFNMVPLCVCICVGAPVYWCVYIDMHICGGLLVLFVLQVMSTTFFKFYLYPLQGEG